MKTFFWAVAAVMVGATAWTVPRAVAGPTPDKILNRMDADGDGRVSRKEWLNPPPAFKKIDSNGDGYLTRDELQARFGGGGGGGANKPNRAPIKWIDVHVHPNPGRGPLRDAKGAIDAAVAVMDENHMSHMVLMPQPQVDAKKSDGEVWPPLPFEAWIEEARKYPDRFVVMGGGGSLNKMIHQDGHDHVDEALKKRFAERARAIMAVGAVGFGEISVLHLSLLPGHAFEDVPGDHPLLMMLADITAKHDVVIDVHFDLVAETMDRPRYLSEDNPGVLGSNLDAFERFLEHNRGAKISWAHTGSDNLGFRTPEFMEEMFEKHPNLYTSLRMNQGRSRQNHPLGPKGIKPDWMRLFKTFPDRFFLGGDQFFIPPALAEGGGPAIKFSKMSANMRDRFNLFLGHLPPKIAKMIAYENAVRVYKIKDTTRISGN